MDRIRRNQWQALTAHQSKRDEDGYELQEHIFTIATKENCKIFGGGMIKDRVENPPHDSVRQNKQWKDNQHQM